jgi:hypothetical protein
MEMKGTITAEWIREWNLRLKGTNPPHRDGILKCMEYLRHFAMASAYVPEREAMETKQAHKRRSYAILHETNTCAVGTREMRVHKLAPNTKWNIVWENVHCAPVHGAVNAVWYKVKMTLYPPILGFIRYG